MRRQGKYRLMIILSFIIALSLMICPIPRTLQWFWPEWLSLTLLYWVVALPQCIGLTGAFCAGLSMDILGGGILGQYSLAMSVVAFFANLLRNRLKLFPFWQQSTGVLVVIGFGQLTLFASQWFIGHPPKTLLYWGSCLSSVILWPWLYMLLKKYQKIFLH